MVGSETDQGQISSGYRSIFQYGQHGCFEIQINAQDQEFVNEVSKQLQELTGVKQRAISAYHLQTKGLEERQN